MSVKQTVDHLNQVKATINALKQQAVYVGLPDASFDDTSKPASLAQIGYVLETGSPAQNIPPRPFLVPGVAAVKDRVGDQLGKVAKEGLKGNFKAAQNRLDNAGLIAQSAVKLKINSNTPPPLSKMTLANRQRRGIKRTNTLVDTGAMRNAITYVVTGRNGAKKK